MLKVTFIYNLALYLTHVLAAPSQQPFGLQPQPTRSPANGDILVPVTLGVMSRCPDALICETAFDNVLKQVREIVNLDLTYIAKINSSEPDFGVTCMHGPEECAGNVQQLCVAKYASAVDWWSFVQCQNFQGRDQVGLPEIARNCADAMKIDWENGGAGECAGQDGSGKGVEGIQLLKESVYTTEALGIRKSCTVLINGREVCVHDGEWKNCEGGHTTADFVRQIKHEYELLNGHYNA